MLCDWSLSIEEKITSNKTATITEILRSIELGNLVDLMSSKKCNIGLNSLDSSTFSSCINFKLILITKPESVHDYNHMSQRHSVTLIPSIET